MIKSNVLQNRLSSFRETNTLSFPFIFVGLGLFFVAQRGFLLWGEGSTTVLAYSLFMSGIGYSVIRNRASLPNRGPWPIYFSLLVIVLLSLASIVYGEDGWGSGFMLYIILLVMLGLYYFSRMKGEELLNLFPYFIAIFASAAIVDGIWAWAEFDASPEVTPRVGGIIDNVDTAGLLLGLSIFFLRDRDNWLAIPALVGIFFTGCYWILPGVLIAYAFRKYSSKRCEAAIGFTMIILILLVLTPFGQAVWQVHSVGSQIDASLDEMGASVTSIEAEGALHSRVLQYERVIDDFAVFGHGHNPNRKAEIEELGDAWRCAHSTVFLLLNQLGIFAVIAWLVATFYVIWRSPLVRFGMIAILPCMLIGSNDFWLWNCLMPFYFVLLGVGAWDIEKRKKELEEV